MAKFLKYAPYVAFGLAIVANGLTIYKFFKDEKAK